ncbi:A/G-specific adenine glycosylase [Allosediminivita pacifica]|uniref:Adenine DNA glycosylase n=1 Tax=Allosediminivita pacifica TaxID=1267769 RepID=A0A2T6AJ12_9RHOB|nr:A/G-specific adenine glycosylase [Allosediminivita pacifica]PTX43815.1 A/G-specific DNA-adenine glycosylase [Allosediminivita pacifica]GGB22005.1 A/G-specific adenine glycosylase [Allosediminivita pacifica]
MRDVADPSDLLDWYDHNARALPWRVGPRARADGVRPDPYRVWLSEIMLQQTTVAAVKSYYEVFTARWPTVSDLAAARDEDVMAAWAGLGYYARARNLLKCARVVAEEHGGVFPADLDALRALPGVGPYTAAAVGAIAFDLPATVVDGNVERVMSRLHDEHTPLPAAKPILTGYAEALTPDGRTGDYAQAVMDLGATICSPRNPACGLCPWRRACAAWEAGTQAELPKKTPKKRKPTRLGIVYLARRVDGAWLLERRPDRGLLGGMLGWPGSEWGEAPQEAPPIRAEWKEVAGEARHTFTHFHLRLKVMTALVPMERQPDVGDFVEQAEFSPADLPTVMRKAFDLARG